MDSVFSRAGPLLTASLVRLHKHAGHSSYTDMRNMLIRAKLWNENEHAEALKKYHKELSMQLSGKAR
jgi:hypothetical protein